ncbi:MAG TPA: LysR family transcriptional regulator [Steroidobacteraceae bacterium]|nr:LysR family transcriptional regulator [Steroidobacteraceae bacterium]
MNTLSDVAVFVRVVELGSFTKAADALAMSKAAVSKYVNRLEQRLDARLLHRTTRRLALTEAGQALFGRSAAALAELGEAENDVAQLTGKPRGLLRVSAPTYFGVTQLAPRIQEFRSLYPEVTLDLDLSDRLVDLVKERFDVAVRISPMRDSTLVATRLAPVPTALVGSPAYFRRHGTPSKPADLSAHDGLGYSILRAPNEWRFRSAKGDWVTVTMRSTIRCNNDFALKQFALDGLGLAYFPRFFVENELAAGKLVQVLQDHPGPELSINAVYETRRHLLPKVNAFLEFLKERFGPGSGSARRP